MTDAEREYFIAEALNMPEGQEAFREAFEPGLIQGLGEWVGKQWQKRVESGYYDLPFRWWQFGSPQDAFVAEVKEHFGVGGGE